MKKQIKYYKKMLQYINVKVSCYLLLGGLMGLQTLTTLIYPWFLSHIIDDAVVTKDIRKIVFYSIFSILCCIIGVFVAIHIQKLSTKIERSITIHLRKQCLEKLLDKNGTFYTNSSSSDLLTLFMQDTEVISCLLSNQLITTINNILLTVGISAYLIYTYPFMAVFVFVTLTILVVYQKHVSANIETITQESRVSIIRLQKSLQELLCNTMSFIIGNLGHYQFQKINQNEKDFAQVKVKTAMCITKYNNYISMISSLLTVLVIGIGSASVVTGTLTIGTLLAFNIYTQKLFSPLTELSNISLELSAANVSLNRIESFLSQSNSQADGIPMSDFFSDNILIEFKNVSFGYTDDELVLKDMSFQIEEGKVHAFVGESGGGKSTIVSLILGLWLPDSGSIHLNKNIMNTFSVKSLREQISIVSQNIFLLDDTIYNNIVLDTKKPNPSKVKDALIKADIWDFVNSLENKWDSYIGENGIRLSGGERQRIAIARAIYRNSNLLVFDEATSMLDNETENFILNEILNIFKGKTIIMIAHRLSTVKKADCISVIHNGKIVEEGTHEGLIQKQGIYYDMYQYQC